jgi:cytochrome c5
MPGRLWSLAAIAAVISLGAVDRSHAQAPAGIAEMMAATMKEPMEAVAQAIKSADSAKFAEAYGRLTATCNACHAATERPFVVIQAPKVSAFPDQDFRPVRP